LREASEFWLARLKQTADGHLVAPQGWSPEHGPREDGVSYDQQLIWELFNNALEAARVLRLSNPLLDRIEAAKRRLLGPKVGRWGQLQEWVSDRDDPHDRHRHTSHLIGVYPGRQISVSQTPTLAKAAKVSLQARGDTGDSRRSWTWPWRCALWSRLGTKECHRMIDGLIEHNLLFNLITTHPPLQLDGNFGITGGMCEMLLQSHTGALELLPGVDFERWPNGFFSGLKARGAFVVSASWHDGTLTEATVDSLVGGDVALRGSHIPVSISNASAKQVAIEAMADQSVRFKTSAGGRYTLSFE
jgi:alpha-L-fucosidase 2